LSEVTVGKHQPALLGGVFIGVLSQVPVVNIANCCCLWVICGGLLTVYLQQQRTPDPVETGDAVIGGLLAGVIGAIISGVIGAIMFSFTGPMVQEQMREALENPEIPAEVRDMLIPLFTGQGMMAVALLISVPVYAVFSMLGALLGLALFRKKTPPVVPGV
jgi:hypothetical protein